MIVQTKMRKWLAKKKKGAHGGGTSTDREGRGIRGWIDTNVKELYAFFGVYVYEGVHPESRLTDYWQVNEDGNHSQVKRDTAEGKEKQESP